MIKNGVSLVTYAVITLSLHDRLRAKALLQVQESLVSITSFLDIQEPWMRHMTIAAFEGYEVEAIALAQQHICVVLRKALWLEAQLQLLSEEEEENDERTRYLFSLLMRPERLLPSTILNTELYGAAERYGLLDESMGQRLTCMEREFPILVGNLFLAKKKPRETLREMAGNLLHLDRMCMKKLRERYGDGLKLLNLKES